jgi:hypothetical protein
MADPPALYGGRDRSALGAARSGGAPAGELPCRICSWPQCRCSEPCFNGSPANATIWDERTDRPRWSGSVAWRCWWDSTSRGADLGSFASHGRGGHRLRTGPFIVSRPPFGCPGQRGGSRVTRFDSPRVCALRLDRACHRASRRAGRSRPSSALGIVCTALAFVLFFALIAEAGPVRATVITYVNPAVAVLLGVALLGERFSAATAVGFVLILEWVGDGDRRGQAVAPPARVH